MIDDRDRKRRREKRARGLLIRSPLRHPRLHSSTAISLLVVAVQNQRRITNSNLPEFASFEFVRRLAHVFRAHRLKWIVFSARHTESRAAV